MNNLFSELKRRNIFRVAGVYAVVGWLIMQVISVMTPALNLPDWVDSFFAILIIAGFPIAILFAWAFELTPEGMKLTKAVPREASITSKTGRKLDYAIIAGLVLVGGLLVAQTFRPVQAPTHITASQASDASIAVLPFVNLSSDPDQDYFSDGISEELLNLFAKIPNLHVTSRSSAFAFKGKDINIPDVARQLGVAHVLEGSVRKSGTKLRITAQLIEAESDKHLWSETYDRELDDIFVVQDEISAAIVEALSDILGVSGAVVAAPTATRTVNPEAYQAFLRGNAIAQQRTKPAKESAQLEYKKAIDLDPDYAPAYAMLAGTYLSLSKESGGYGDLTLAEIEESAGPLIEKALELDPNLSEAHTVLGRLQTDQRKFDEALVSFNRALEINPNSIHAYNDLAIYYQDTGEADKIFEVLNKAYKLDPLDTRSAGNLALLKVFRGELDEAEKIGNNLVTLGSEAGYRRLADVAINRGDNEAFVGHALAGLEHDPTNTAILSALAWRLALNGHPDDAMEIFPVMKSGILFASLDAEAALASAKDDFAEDPDNVGTMAAVAGGYQLAGDWPQARRYMERAFKKTDETFEINELVDLHNMRRKTGDLEKANELIPKIEAAIRAQEKANWNGAQHSAQQARGYAVLGDMDKALTLLKRSAERGMFGAPEAIKIFRVEFEDVHDDPRMDEILALMQTKNAERMSAFYTAVCTPPEERFWQPSRVSCGAAKAKYGLAYDVK